MSITQIITALPPAPQRTDAPADFITKADAHVASLDQFVTQTNTVTDEINSTVTSVNVDAVAAENSALTSAASAVDSANFANNSASSANFVGEWSTLIGALNVPSSVSHLGALWILTVDLVDVTLSEPSITGDWINSSASAWNDPKSANFDIIAGQSYLVDGSGGVVDGSLPATIITNQSFIVHNESISTNLVRVLNPNFTIKGAGGSLLAGDNLILEAGDTVNLVARSNSILEVV